jgi:hypothetical protein
MYSLHITLFNPVLLFLLHNFSFFLFFFLGIGREEEAKVGLARV